ncbi:hypothetical protein MNV49_007977 [Pseudohyphozyma bogoriensis]|nr:hypothetical protein MNV49_007977 [Pseudohyphozyma bogoriensis]
MAHPAPPTPPEVLLIVFKNLSTGDLRTCTMVAKAWRQVATAELYRTITIASWTSPQGYQLANDLAKRPHLAQLCHIFAVRIQRKEWRLKDRVDAFARDWRTNIESVPTVKAEYLVRLEEAKAAWKPLEVLGPRTARPGRAGPTTSRRGREREDEQSELDEATERVLENKSWEKLRNKAKGSFLNNLLLSDAPDLEDWAWLRPGGERNATSALIDMISKMTNLQHLHVAGFALSDASSETLIQASKVFPNLRSVIDAGQHDDSRQIVSYFGNSSVQLLKLGAWDYKVDRGISQSHLRKFRTRFSYKDWWFKSIFQAPLHYLSISAEDLCSKWEGEGALYKRHFQDSDGESDFDVHSQKDDGDEDAVREDSTVDSESDDDDEPFPPYHFLRHLRLHFDGPSTTPATKSFPPRLQRLVSALKIVSFGTGEIRADVLAALPKTVQELDFSSPQFFNSNELHTLSEILPKLPDLSTIRLRAEDENVVQRANAEWKELTKEMVSPPELVWETSGGHVGASTRGRLRHEPVWKTKGCRCCGQYDWD